MVHGHCIQLQCARRGNASAGPVQLVGLYGQRALACMDNAASHVEQLHRVQAKVAGIAGQGATTVVEAAGDVDPGIGRTCRAQRATHVRQRTGADLLRSVGGDRAAVITQRPAHLQRHRLVAGGVQRTARVVQLAGLDADLLRGGGACAEIQRLTLQLQLAVADDAPAVALQRGGIDLQQAVTRLLDTAAAVVQRRSRHLHARAAGDDTLVAVVEQAVGLDHQPCGAAHRAALVVDAAGADAKPTIGQDAAAAVVEVLADDQLAGRCTCGLQRAARVEQRGTAQVQPAVAGHGTAAVVDAFARAQPQHVIAGGGERAAGGDQGAGVDLDALGGGDTCPQVGGGALEQQAAIADQRAAGAVERGGVDRQNAFAGVLHGAASIAEHRHLDAEVAVAGQQAALAVVQRADHVDRAAFGTGRDDLAGPVVERLYVQCDALGLQSGTAMVYAVRLQGDAACAGDGAALTIQLPGMQQQALSAGMAERALHVGHAARVDLQRGAIACEQAVAVGAATIGKLAGFNVLGTVAGDGARVVGQPPADLQRQRSAASSAQRTGTVVQAVGHDVELLGRHAAAAEVQRPSLQSQCAGSTDAAALARQCFRLDVQVAVGRDRAVAVLQLCCPDRRGRFTRCDQRAVVVDEAPRTHVDGAIAAQRSAGIVEQATGLQLQRLGAKRTQLATRGGHAVAVDADALRRLGAVAQIEGAALQVQRTVAEQGATGAGQVLRGDGQAAGTGLLHGSAGFAEGAPVDVEVAIAGEGAAITVVQRALHAQDIAPGTGGDDAPAAVVQPGRRDIQLRGSQRRALVVDLGRRELQGTGSRRCPHG
ncbi:hypothetical protein G6F24_012297 [Rhizopus arrhizus]|nr:hypothetical protein G6F24_012297 [Rhizopus arrhizus]